MKRMKYIKLMAGTIAFGMFLSACKKEIAFVIKKEKIESKNKDFTTSAITEIPETSETIIESEIITETSTNHKINQADILEETEAIEQTCNTEQTTEMEENRAPEETTEQEVVPTLPEIIEELPINIIAYTTTTVNLRSSNNTKALIIKEIDPNIPVYRLASCQNNWDLVQVGDAIGFICRDYLMYTTETYENDHKIVLKNDIAVTTTELNFRSGPSTNYPVKKTLITKRENELTEIDMVFKENEELRVVAEVDDEWLMIEYNGEFGYVHKDYTISLLEKLNDFCLTLEAPEFDLKKVVYATSSLNIRKENTTESEIIRTLDTYESLRVLVEYEDWYLIMTNEHEFGYVNNAYVKELEGKTTITDISQQRTYMYNDDERLTYTPVTTGKDSTPTDIGLFHIYYMDRNIYLNGDKDWVIYWIAYTGSVEGFHDAWWRQVYGEQNHHTSGSNGCTNTPYAAVKTMYENSYEGQKVLVHK